MSTTAPRTTGGVGERLPRTDGRAKVTGEFAYSSDLRVDGMLFGATLRSPHRVGAHPRRSTRRRRARSRASARC